MDTLVAWYRRLAKAYVDGSDEEVEQLRRQMRSELNIYPSLAAIEAAAKEFGLGRSADLTVSGHFHNRPRADALEAIIVEAAEWRSRWNGWRGNSACLSALRER